MVYLLYACDKEKNFGSDILIAATESFSLFIAALNRGIEDWGMEYDAAFPTQYVDDMDNHLSYGRIIALTSEEQSEQLSPAEMYSKCHNKR